MTAGEKGRGQPLIALLMVLGGWIAMRMLLCEYPAMSAAPAAIMASTVNLEAASGWEQGSLRFAAFRGPQSFPGVRPVHLANGSRVIARAAGEAGGVHFELRPYSDREWPDSAFTDSPSPLSLDSGVPALAGAGLARDVNPGGAPWLAASHADAVEDRWSADGWLMLRQGGNVSLANGVLPSTYGASQLGAVLRYRLAPGSLHRPSAYSRMTAALNGSREAELALGLGVRPIAGLPIVTAGELRALRRPGATVLRPAILVWTELALLALPLDARGEAYAQLGYVGGSYDTLFVDGQLRIDKPLASLGKASLHAGGGAWGGAQQGASRVDLGPTASIDLPVGEGVSLRLGVDWRLRVGGNAHPGSGPAATLSAGF